MRATTGGERVDFVPLARSHLPEDSRP